MTYQKQQFKNLKILKIVPILFFLFLLSISSQAQAILYNPGDTLDPQCSPTDPNCDVRPSVSVPTGAAAGSLVYASATDTWASLTIGSNGQILKVVNGALSWSSDSAYALLSGRAGGQTLIGGTNANNPLILQANSASSGNSPDSAGLEVKVGNSGSITALTILNNGNVGIGTTNPTAALGINGDINISGNIIPSSNITYTLGTLEKQWKDVYIGPGSLYVNGQKVLQTDANQDVNITADTNQSLVLKTYGTGDVEINPTLSGQILLKGDVRLSSDKKFTGGINFDNISINNNVIQATSLNGGISLTPAGLGGVYITNGNFGVGTTSPMQKLDVAGNFQLSGALMPLGLAGQAGQFLISQGVGLAPAWTSNLSPSALTLNTGQILVGNDSNQASPVTLSGDASLSSSGLFTLATTTVISGSYGTSSTNIPSLTIDAKGRIVSASNRLLTKADFGLSNVEDVSISDYISSWNGSTELNTLGTITSGTWNGGTLAIEYGGTGKTSAKEAITALLPSQDGNIGKFLMTNGDAADWQELSIPVLDWGNINGTLSEQLDLQAALNSKQNNLSFGNLTETSSSVLNITGGTGAVIGSGLSIGVKQASSTVSGFLSNIDWSTFNNKISSQWTTSDSNIYYNLGKVGIGMTNPSYPLDVEGTIHFGQGANGYAMLQSGSWGTELGFTDDHDHAMAVRYTDTGNFQFGGLLGGSDGIIVDPEGKVGIGTTNPLASLELKNTGEIFVRASGSGYGNEILGFEMLRDSGTWGDDARGFRIYRAADQTDARYNRLNIEATNRLGEIGSVLSINGDSRNVGIGTTDPQYPLDVLATGSNYLRVNGNGVANNDGYFTINNYTAAEAIFAPIFMAKSNNVSYPGMAFIGDVATDTGTQPIIRFQARQNNTTVATRPLFSFENFTGATPMTILANGNVGIGTTVPGEKLTIKADANLEPLNIQATNGYNLIRFQDLTGSDRMWFGNDSGARFRIRNLVANGDIMFSPGANGHSYFETGNVGIGTTSPSYKFHIYQATGALFNMVESGISNATIGTIIKNTSKSYFFGQNYYAANAFEIDDLTTGVNRLTILTGGNVGIGTTNPAAKLTLQQSDQAYAQPGDTATWDMAFGIAANTAKISGMDFKNFNAAGQVRLMARNNQDDYVMVNSFGSTAAGTIFGINRTNTHAVFGQGVTDTTKKLAIGTYNAGDLIFGTNNIERMRILSTGSVGIGTTTPEGAFHLFGSVYEDNIPAMTSNTAPSPLVASASSNYNDPQYYPWNAFNKNKAQLGWITQGGISTGWLKLDLGVMGAKTIREYTITSPNSGSYINAAPKTWTLQGSNDDSNWTTLDTETNVAAWVISETRQYTVDSPASYRYYKLDVTLNQGYTTYLMVSELRLLESGSRSALLYDKKGTFNIKGIPGQWDKLQSWQNINGSEIASVDVLGNITASIFTATSSITTPILNVNTLTNTSAQNASIATLFVPNTGLNLTASAVTTGVTAALIPIQYSPALKQLGYAWDTDGSSAYQSFRSWVEPYVGSTVNGRLKWENARSAITEAAHYELMSLNNNGEFNVLGQIFADESLANPNLDSGTNWSQTGSCALTSNAATYTHNATQGSLYQTNDAMAANGGIALKPNRWYRFTYVTSAPTITVRAFLDEVYTSAERIYLPGVTPAAGVGPQQITFKTNSSPSGFKIQFTSAVGAITFDTFSLKEIQSGDIVANGLFTGGGTSGLKIDSLGNVGIGTSTPTKALSVVGEGLFSNTLTISGGGLAVTGTTTFSSLGTGAVYSSGGTLINTDPSDLVLKKNILNLNNSLDKIMQLRPVSFEWKDTGEASQGFIAQEVETVIPELVGINPGNFKGLYTTRFIPYLVKAIQEQQARINSWSSYNSNPGLSLADLNNLVLSGGLKITGHVSFDEDTVGEATILSGQTEILINFSSDYLERPMITISPQADVLGSYWVSEVTAQSFKIKLHAAQLSDIAFFWHAFAKKDEFFPVLPPSDLDISSTTIEVEAGGDNEETDPINTDDSSPPPIITEIPEEISSENIGDGSGSPLVLEENIINSSLDGLEINSQPIDNAADSPDGASIDAGNINSSEETSNTN